MERERGRKGREGEKREGEEQSGQCKRRQRGGREIRRVCEREVERERAKDFKMESSGKKFMIERSGEKFMMERSGKSL